jgi:hypothetical protein
LNWLETGERTLFGPDLVKDAEEKVQVIWENLKIAQMRQKSYHNKGTAPRHFEVGDYVYLKVSPTKGVQRFGVKGKLAPRYIGPYEVIEVCGPVAYRIQLPEQFSAVHNVFHVTQLKKGMPVLENEVITEANAWIEPDFSLIEHPLRVLDQKRAKDPKTNSKNVQNTMESPHERRDNLGDGGIPQRQVSGIPAISKL